MINSETDNRTQLPNKSPAWREIFVGGTPDSEDALFRQLAQDIVRVQKANQHKVKGAVPDRTLHAKGVVGVTNATFEINSNIPHHLIVDYIRPAARYPVTIRLSNASGTRRPDHVPDMRGAALRIELPGGEHHDLFLTSYPVSHARDARQFVAFAKAAAGPKALMLPRLVFAFGISETLRILGNIKRGVRTSESLARETYWSRGAVLWGTAGPMRFRLRPINNAQPTAAPSPNDPDCLFHEFVGRLLCDDVKFDFCVQPYVNETKTPIEDAAVEWKDEDTQPIAIATISIPKQNLKSDDAKATQREVDELSFSPWNAPANFRPLGNINRARRIVYSASAAGWLNPK